MTGVLRAVTDEAFEIETYHGTVFIARRAFVRMKFADESDYGLYEPPKTTS